MDIWDVNCVFLQPENKEGVGDQFLSGRLSQEVQPRVLQYQGSSLQLSLDGEIGAPIQITHTQNNMQSV